MSRQSTRWDSPVASIKTIVLLFAYLLCPIHSNAYSSDSTRADSSRTRWILSMDARSTIINRRHLKVKGVKTGLSFGEKGHKITIGYYWLNYNSNIRLINLREKLTESINIAGYTKTDVGFVSFAYWYPLHTGKKWIVSLPAELGVGQESAAYRQLSGSEYNGRKESFFYPYQLGLYAEYKATPWVGISLQTGYRDAFYHGPLRRQFRGIYYSYGLTFYPGRILRDVKGYLTKKSR